MRRNKFVMNFNEFLKIGKIREFLRILKRYASDSYSMLYLAN